MFKRHRRLRANAAIRNMIREHKLDVSDLIYPVFVVNGSCIKLEIASMPGVYHFSIDELIKELQEVTRLGILSIMLFGIPKIKDAAGSEADIEDGIIQRAAKEIKKIYPDLYIMADTCLCQYTDHGHCGVIVNQQIDNDKSLERLSNIALSYAHAGVDMIAPSNMMDGFVYSIRNKLDNNNFNHIPILSYAVKYASAFYGPFRDAVSSTPQFGDRKSYQMDPANSREAIREASSDDAEGADMLMVKPGMAYMDIISDLRNQFDHPIVTYNVSGEYAMVKAAALNGWIDEQQTVLEILLGFKRAGADLILTYHAKDAAKWLKV